MAQFRARGELAFDHSKQTRKFLFLLLAAALTIPLSYWRVRSMNATIELAKIFLFYLMVVQLVDSKRRFRIFFFLYGALICYLAITSMNDYFRGQLLFAQGIDRAVGKTSAGGGPNEMGAPGLHDPRVPAARHARGAARLALRLPAGPARAGGHAGHHGSRSGFLASSRR